MIDRQHRQEDLDVVLTDEQRIATETRAWTAKQPSIPEGADGIHINVILPAIGERALSASQVVEQLPPAA